MARRYSRRVVPSRSPAAPLRALGRGRVFDSFGLVAGVTGTTEKGTEKVEDVLAKDARFARSIKGR